MYGRQLTAFEMAEQNSEYHFGSTLEEQVWLVDWRAMGSPNCTIYIVSPTDGWPCKIGISTAPRKRIASLQTSVWKQLHVAWCAWLPSVAAARALEQKCHQSLSDTGKWLHGEWFDLRPDKAREMVEFDAMLIGADLGLGVPDGEALRQVEALYADTFLRPHRIKAKAGKEHDRRAWGS